jgi:membrane protease YdiL (CAAX protease family)
MRVPVSLAWVIMTMFVLTAGLLRRFHDDIPESPFLHPLVGNLLFAGIFVLLLVASRERSSGAVRGRGIRLGSLTPLLLMLLIEKWISLGFYEPLFNRISSPGVPDALGNAHFLAFAGAALLATCLLLARLSEPTRRKTLRRLRPLRLPVALLQVLICALGTYLILGLISLALGLPLYLRWPTAGSLLAWVLVGQAVIALGEEVYYRGLLFGEIERLAPRLGLRAAVGRRWIAVALTSTLFAMEHVDLTLPWSFIARQAVFTASLGALFALLIAISGNLYLAAGVHAWINWLLLGAAPHFADKNGAPVLPAGTYIGVTLILAFSMAFVFRRRRLRSAIVLRAPRAHRETTRTLDRV